ncbi:hypothetical protein GGD81_004157 [Rhodobium orientis]|uniref:von Hippel-Lindau disease tumour suppressor beta domain-containing protein n=1 Tax=Rhodobium orientis TaxID=34017 RepID=A0A327JIT6_9HYPH|nr:hypothetical protein [Rhodobium orientis]MBB4305089.1 hypothetical protein [Rhodobium orientis]MBK5952157.1 hypothetical protein [Rhodobium orientis]RAI25626.1 hypothetical protein CH339_17255 [Rhodobium orientis]
MLTVIGATIVAAFLGSPPAEAIAPAPDASPVIKVQKGIRPLRGRNCPRPRAVQSPHSNRSTQIRFINSLNSPVELYWINFRGRWVQYATLRPGQSYSQQTYVGHAWIAYEINANDCVGNSLYFATNDRGQWVEWHY